MTGIQWTQEQREDAYMRWAYEYNKNLTETARQLDIPLRTVQYWKSKDHWDSRYAAETAEIAGFAFTYGLDELRLGVSAAALQLVKDASNPALQHSERLASQRLLFSMMVSNIGSENAGPTHISLIDARSIHNPPSLPNSNDPDLISSRAIEANITKANELQSRNRRKG
jgi:hypothetical protein